MTQADQSAWLAELMRLADVYAIRDGNIESEDDYADSLTARAAILTHASARPQITDEREALAELVACKDLKERAEALHFAGPSSSIGEEWEAEYYRLRLEYIRRQPAAWDRARALLAVPQQPQERNHQENPQ